MSDISVIKRITPLRRVLDNYRRQNKTIGFVPTMGYLHAGHISLICASVRENDVTVVSIYVNPAQFSPTEDFDSYPRDFKRDIEICKNAGVDIIFAPSSANMYPAGFASFVELQGVSAELEGEFRPTHFRGVTTVVAKLFNIVNPDIVYLGQKDAQQAFIISKMRNDLNFNCKIKIMPTKRDINGIALSSRNVRLSKEDYNIALELSRTLKFGKRLYSENKNIKTQILLDKLKKYISQFSQIKLDYIDLRERSTFSRPEKITGKCYLLIAARVGTVRLIDNMIIG